MTIKVMKIGKGYGVYAKPKTGRPTLVKKFKTKKSANAYATRSKRLAKKARSLWKEFGF